MNIESKQPGPRRDTNAVAVEGRVFDIQRFSIHDGPGIRTTVFLKGCPLRCLWCHNPEGMSAAEVVSFLPERCIGCGDCVRACPHDAHRLEAPEGNGHRVVHVYHRARCETCGQCTQICDTRALEWVGRHMTVEQVMSEVRRDRAFYETSGGGLTLSGGEPLAQIEFTVALLCAAREEGFHRVVETSGFVSWQRFERLLPLVDLFLFDFKETDPLRHAEFTGQSNEIILKNLRALVGQGARVQMQCPIVPGFNDREDHLEGIRALASSLPNLAGVQLLPYHPLGKSKLQRFGLTLAAELPSEPLPPAVLDRWVNDLRERGVPVINAARPAASHR
ncbi:MAG TPA: glycyl-radical enzyme activating protein [Terriglobia bacterium]|nr:glycyl-radical enzyme activating protein [Terriglobia bacterium]